ncbi:MAG TPA: DNA polymerase III subunit beta [Actinomycetota bacterium]
MKVVIERDRFSQAVGWILRSVSARATLPALGGVLFDASSAALRLAGTDLELSGEAEVEAKIEEAGSALLPGRVLGEIARSLPDGAVRIVVSGSEAKLTCGAAEFTLRTLPIEDFPATTQPSGEPAGSLPAETFATAVAQVTRAASADEARPVLTGTLVDATEGKVTLVSTDSYRLAVRSIAWTGPAEGVKRVIPARALAEAARAADGAETVEVTLGESQASFTAGAWRLTTRLIEGEFPNWTQLVPAELPHQLRLDRAALTEAVRRVGILAQSGSAVKIEFATDGAKLLAASQDVGDATELVEGKFEGEPLTVAFNPQYLLDGLNAVEGGEVVIAVRDGLKPALVRAPEDQEGFVYLIMPVRIQ